MGASQGPLNLKIKILLLPYLLPPLPPTSAFIIWLTISDNLIIHFTQTSSLLSIVNTHIHFSHYLLPPCPLAPFPPCLLASFKGEVFQIICNMGVGGFTSFQGLLIWT